jgi:hypothetical protein
MRPRCRKSDMRQKAKSQAKHRGSDLSPHLGCFVVTEETGVVGDVCCADLRQVVPVSIKEETSDLRLVLEADVLADYRPSLCGDLSACPEQPEVSVVSRVESEV